MGESVSVQGGSHLAVKVEGVLVHDARPGIFRKAAEIVITLISQLQARQHNQTDSKVLEKSFGPTMKIRFIIFIF